VLVTVSCAVLQAIQFLEDYHLKDDEDERKQQKVCISWWSTPYAVTVTQIDVFSWCLLRQWVTSLINALCGAPRVVE